MANTCWGVLWTKVLDRQKLASRFVIFLLLPSFLPSFLPFPVLWAALEPLDHIYEFEVFQYQSNLVQTEKISYYLPYIHRPAPGRDFKDQTCFLFCALLQIKKGFRMGVVCGCGVGGCDAVMLCCNLPSSELFTKRLPHWRSNWNVTLLPFFFLSNRLKSIWLRCRLNAAFPRERLSTLKMTTLH